MKRLIASCGCRRRHQFFGSDNISNRDLGYSQTSPEPLPNAFYVARPVPETQLQGIHILVGLFLVPVVPLLIDINKVNLGGSHYTASLVLEPEVVAS